MEDRVNEGPLYGLRVLEAAEWVAGPSLCAILSDWGANVVKLERLQGGDAMRGVLAVGGLPMRAVNYPFELANRGKRSVALDLAAPEADEIVSRLIQSSDVFVTNFRQTAIQKLHLGYDRLSQINHRLIYVKICAYGTLGPDTERAGYDFAAFWARAGVGSAIGEPDSPPPTQPHGLGDQVTAICALGGVLAALLARERTGMGEEVVVSLLNAGVWANAVDIMAASLGETELPRLSRKEAPNPLWNTYEARDGKWLQIIMLQTDPYWPRFCKAIDRTDLEHDPRFNSHAQRCHNNKDLINILDSVFRSKSQQQWRKLLDQYDLIWAPVQTAYEVARDPQVLENGYLVPIKHATGLVNMVASPVKFNRMRSRVNTPAPQMGQHTEEVLLELGYSWQDISRLKDKSVIL